MKVNYISSSSPTRARQNAPAQPGIHNAPSLARFAVLLTLEWVAAPMEIHFVHKNAATGKLAVIGVFVEEGAENAVLKHFVGHLPTTKDATYDDATNSFKASDLIPGDQSYFTYNGSLTTPPCSEIVTWIVMEHHIEASTAQIHDFEVLEHENARPTQPIEGRTIKYHKG
jgi:carbonic anhydrase